MSQDNVIYVKKYNATDSFLFPVNRREIWRYSGYLDHTKKKDDELERLLDEVIDELKVSFQFQVCYRRMKVDWENGIPVLPFSCASRDLAKCLKGCKEIIIFAATIGLEIDRKIARYERFSPAKALLIHAYGAERIESLCDGFCEDIRKEVEKEGLWCSPRFSPGYGDVPLETQTDFFRLLDCNRKIGVSLNDSLLMVPSKSVTAIFGIGDCGNKKTVLKDNKCESCNNKNCEYRNTNNLTEVKNIYEEGME